MERSGQSLETFAVKVALETLAEEENKMVVTCMEEGEEALDLQIVVWISVGIAVVGEAGVVCWEILSPVGASE